jgi:hypothetical protein
MTQFPPSAEVEDLSRQICGLYRQHYGQVLESINAAYDRAEDMHMDVLEKPVPPYEGPETPEKEVFEATRKIAFGMQTELDRPKEHDQNAARAAQCALEDRLGQILAQDPPAFVVKEIGTPPAPSGDARRHCSDSRYWAKTAGAAGPLTERQLWERGAGALGALVYGRHVEPDHIHEAWEEANNSQTTADEQMVIDGTVSARHFSEVFRLTRTVAYELDVRGLGNQGLT